MRHNGGARIKSILDKRETSQLTAENNNAKKPDDDPATAAKMLDIIEAFVRYFDGSVTYTSRAQFVTQCVGEAREILKSHGRSERS